MPEDVYDFEGLNPGELLTVDEHAQPFDYATRLREKGHTRHSPPDAGGLFQALATDYVPSRVVDLPPRVVTKVKVKVVRSPEEIIANCILIFGLMLCLAGVVYCYSVLVVWAGIIRPYQDLTDFIMRTQMQPGASCTITSAQIYSHTLGDDDNALYDAKISFTLHTPGGRNYNTTEHDAPSFTSSDDAQAYLLRYQVHHIYSCWYDPADPTVAMFVNLDPGGIAGLVGWSFSFLLFAVLPLALLIWAIRRGYVRKIWEHRHFL